ncbi:MAG: hypothetical protein Q8Q50_15285 [Methylobacter sp.]|nr:hypothetical protein [Methylobacter sp.]
MKKSILLIAMITSYSVSAAPLPEQLEKLNGSCPSGYSSSGRNYCLASNSNSRAAIAKQGTSCPRGYSSSGSNYCLANK